MFVRLQIVVPTVAGAIVLVSACFVLVYRCRVAVFAKFNVHPFDVDECEGEDMAFDAFVSCAWPDDALAQQVVTASSTSSSQYIRRNLHWLPVSRRIPRYQFLLHFTTWKTLHTAQPLYLSQLICHYLPSTFL